MDSPSKNDWARIPSAVAATGIIDAMGSMQLESPSRGRDEDTKAAIRDRRKSANQIIPSQTLLSLSASSQEIVEKLLQPELLGNNGNVNVRWQESLLATPVKPKPRVKMPGSLFDPSIDSSQSQAGTDNKRESPVATEQDQLTQPATEADFPSPSSTARRHPQLLVRSMSIEERDMFLSNLTQSSGAVAHVVPAGDVHNLQASAIKIGFHARVVVNKDKLNREAILVLGRDEDAVQRLYEQVEMERKQSSTSRLGAAAGGAMVGAVGAFAGLAFS